MIRLIFVVVGLAWITPFSDAVFGSPLTAIHPELQLFQHRKAQKSWEEGHYAEKSENLISAVTEHVRFNSLQHRNGSNFTECIKTLTHFAYDSIRKKPYAMKALDADGKLPSGVKRGNIKWSGRYYECEQIKAESFNGKWCELAIGPKVPTPAIIGSVGFSVGICLPDTCPEEFFIDMFHRHMANFNITESTTLKCPVQLTKWTVVDIISMFVFSLLLFLAVLGTILDFVFDRELEKEKKQLSINGDNIAICRELHNAQNPSVRAEVAASFSVVKNTGILLSTSCKPGIIGTLHGIRFISITWVLLAHTYVMAMGAVDNSADLMDWSLKAFSFQAMSNASFSVDSFFFLSGLLVTYLALKDSKQFNGRNVPMMYFQRFIRLTPAYAFLILFSVGFYGKLGDGPYWPGYFNTTRTVCLDYWWTNLLYINNLYPSDLTDECFAMGWYLANDMQFYLLAPISILLLKRRPKLGLSLLIFGVFSSVLVTGIISTHYQSQPGPVAMALLANDILGNLHGGSDLRPNSTIHVTNFSAPQMSSKDLFWSDTYTKPWCRIGAYLVGMMTGYILYRTKLKITMPKLFAVCGWIVAAGLNVSLVYGLWPYVRTATPMVASLASFYDAMSRPMWALGLAWVVIACTTGYGGPINAFLSWKLFIPLSRLTFCIYLVHPLIIGWWYNTLETTIHFSNVQFAFFFMAVLISSVAVAYVMSMLFEVPFINLSKMLLPRRARPQQIENQQLLDDNGENPDT